MKRILASCVILGFCTQAFAAATPSTNTAFSKRSYLGFAVGDMFTRVEGDDFLGTGPGWPADHYSPTSISDAPFIVASTGYTWEQPSTWLPNYSLGLRAMYMQSATVSGYIDQYSLPGFRNYYYSYDIQMLNFLGIAKVDLVRWHGIMPYLTAGAGIANYFTSDYIERATPNVTARVSPNFGGGGGTNFTYLLGGGFDFAVRDDIWINVEFNYANYGTISTDKGANYTTLTGTNYDNETLSNKIAATTVFLGLTFYPA